MVWCTDNISSLGKNAKACGKRNVPVSLLDRIPGVKILLIMTFSNLTRGAWNSYLKLNFLKNRLFNTV